MVLDVKLEWVLAEVGAHRFSGMAKPDCWINITILADIIENRACGNSG
jgi:hypothetical protein